MRHRRLAWCSLAGTLCSSPGGPVPAAQDRPLAGRVMLPGGGPGALARRGACAKQRGRLTRRAPAQL